MQNNIVLKFNAKFIIADNYLLPFAIRKSKLWITVQNSRKLLKGTLQSHSRVTLVNGKSFSQLIAFPLFFFEI